LEKRFITATPETMRSRVQGDRQHHLIHHAREPPLVDPGDLLGIDQLDPRQLRQASGADISVVSGMETESVATLPGRSIHGRTEIDDMK
jgi:hypothetical protein